ncbi:MAG: cation:proton antiporter subunit C [Pseudomonadota bacterium]|nr:cation:proton antiporter subunit C [Pseudomonadota bacterium]
MNQPLLFALTAAALFGVGLYGFLVHAHLLRKILAVNVMASAVFLLLVAVAKREGAAAVDPLPHALVLTGIIVSISATAFALAVLKRLHREKGTAALPADGGDAG